MLLALRGARPDGVPHRTFVHTGRHLVTVLRPDDPLLRPDDGHESAVLSTAVARAARTIPDALADELLSAADAAGLGLADRLLWRVVRTPQDDEADTLSPGGLVPPPALAGARRAPSCGRPTAARCPACTGRAAGRTRAAGWRTPACRGRWPPVS